MKNALATLKKPTNIMSFVAIVLILLEIAVMFLPCFTMAPKATRKDPNPPASDYSLMNYMWTDTEAMEAGFEKLMKRYRVNDNVTDFVLIVLFSILAVIFVLLDVKNSFEIFNTLGQSVIKFLSHIAVLLWAGMSLYTFLFSWILPFSNTMVPTLGLIVSIAGVVAAAVRVIFDILPALRKNKAAA